MPFPLTGSIQTAGRLLSCKASGSNERLPEGGLFVCLAKMQMRHN